MPVAHKEPIFNAPRGIVALLVLLAAVHGARQFIAPDQDEWLILAGAFIPARYGTEVLPGGETAKVASFVTHAFLHADLTHLAVNSGWLLAFGTMVARRLDGLRFALLFAVSAIAGAALFLLFNPGLPQPMVGASGAISGMMGAAVRFMFVPGARDDRQGVPSRAPSMSLGELMRDSRARMMIISWMALNLLFGVVLGTVISAGGIAWEAHMGGFIAGLLFLPLLERSQRGRANPPIADDLGNI